MNKSNTQVTAQEYEAKIPLSWKLKIAFIAAADKVGYKAAKVLASPKRVVTNVWSPVKKALDEREEVKRAQLDREIDAEFHRGLQNRLANPMLHAQRAKAMWEDIPQNGSVELVDSWHWLRRSREERVHILGGPYEKTLLKLMESGGKNFIISVPTPSGKYTGSAGVTVAEMDFDEKSGCFELRGYLQGLPFCSTRAFHGFYYPRPGANKHIKGVIYCRYRPEYPELQQLAEQEESS